MKVKISSIVENQFPAFLKEESPLLVEAIQQYFISGEFPGGPFDLISNLDEYTRLENLVDTVSSTKLLVGISFYDTTLNVVSTKGFPDSYGLIKIDNEIITYTSKTETSFLGCVRGFSGISNDQLEFATSEVNSHLSNATVENLSILFLSKFLDKIKKQLIPGFVGRDLANQLNETTFIERSKDFYSTKGTDRSFEILFAALYSEPVKVIHPSDYLFTPSSAEYRISKDLVVEAVVGDPLTLENRTLFQEETVNYRAAKGSISGVEKVIRGGKTYYIVSLDYGYNKDIIVSGSVFGEFSIHPKTQVTNLAVNGSTVLSVDSTAGFPASGSLLLENETVITYTSKSITQFFGCSGIIADINPGSFVSFIDQSETTALGLAYGYSGTASTDIVVVRISGVIEDLEQFEDAYHINVGDNIRPKSLGKISTDIRTKNWFYNIPIKYNIASINLLNSQTNQYKIDTLDDNILIAGDGLNIVYNNGTILSSTVTSKTSLQTVIVECQTPINATLVDHIERKISSVNSSLYPSVNTISSNIQNVYEDSNADVIVSAPSLPQYSNQPLVASNRSITLNGSFSGTSLNYINHGFLSGDVVIYNYQGSNGLGISKGTYYIKRINDDSFSLATSRAKLRSGEFVIVNGTVTNNTLSYNDFANKTLESQKLFRKISTPVSPKTRQQTPIGNIGILNNGVEIVNYKSKDVVFYGPVESIDIVSPGSDYDVINPPIVEVTDETGSGLIANCVVTGSLKEIRIVDRGLNYSSEPTITITGGNGSGASAKAEIAFFEHSVSFNSSAINDNTVGFGTYHGFNNGEQIIYKPDGESKVSGITTDSEYFASKVNETDIRLHKSFDDAVVGINTINISYTGFAIHRFVSYESKQKLSSITIVNPGQNYTNRKIAATSSGINTATDTIEIKNHKFNSGELIVYSGYTGSSISGITTNVSYYVTTLDSDNFKLSEVSPKQKDFYYKNKQYVNLTSSGTGTHYFTDEPIQVTLYGISGVGTTNSTIYTASVQPIFRGKIDSVFIDNAGQKYGQEDILNYNRQPTINLNSGRDAQLQAIISNGKIKQVLVLSSGSGYNSPPDIIINGSGNGAKLTPIIKNGELTEVKIIDSGYGYLSNDIAITVVPAGIGGQLRVTPKQWTINLIERLLQTSKIGTDDGIISSGLNSNFGLQYVHGYAPRKYRQLISGKKYVSGNLTYQPDLKLDSANRELLSDTHSPIIGWAYDGNPIYGPYGFDKSTGTVKLIKSGYSVAIDSSRPSLTLYKQGLFVEDYVFTNSGDLDENNGRYCITPEFPNGTYAYFATLNGTVATDPTNTFYNYFTPSFPYFIGEAFTNQKIDFNFDRNSNQDYIELNKTDWTRNTQPLLLDSESSKYEYLISPYNEYEQNATVTSTISGGIQAVNVKSGGDNYKVGDKVLFDSQKSGGVNANAFVYELQGKNVSSISVATTTVFDVEFTPNSQYNIIGFSSLPHNFKNNDIVTIRNVNYNRTLLTNTFTVKVESQKYTLYSDVPAKALTGITTYFNVYGNLNYPYIRENDILQIDAEQIKVLNIDTHSSRIFVEREYNGTVGSYHTIGATLIEVPRKFSLVAPSDIFTTGYVNRELYFEPSQSLGLGTGTTVVFSNPGVGLTSIFVPTRSIYIPDHQLETGDQLFYRLNDGSEITVSTNGITTTLLKDQSTLYAVKYNNSFIGLSTEKVGIGSTGNFVGYGTTGAAKILYYNYSGSGKKHSFITLKPTTKGQVDKNDAYVYVNSDPQLNVNDKVIINAISKNTQTIKVVYNSATQRMILNPRAFTALDVDTVNSILSIPNHQYYTGQKILYTSNSPISGLENNGIYFVVVINSNKISLARTSYNALLDQPIIIQFNSVSAGTLYEINPAIKVTKNNTLLFDLSDSSLSVSDGSILAPAFDFDFYYDSTFINKFETTFNSTIFNVRKSGSIGITTDANIRLVYDEQVPNKLFYKLTPRKNKPIFVDTDISDNNSINFSDSAYNGEQSVTGIGTTVFSYTLAEYPESSSYYDNINYTTNSTNATGPIESIKVTNRGTGYKFLPGITSIVTNDGENAILEVVSDTIGRINNVQLNDIGFNYPSDLTLKPLTQTSVVLKVIPQTALGTIKIVSPGINYISAPNLVLLDGLSLKQVPDVDMRYQLGDKEVTIVKNSKGINNVKPLIIPTNNSNAIGISSISFNDSTKDVSLVLSTSYSYIEEFPFAVGDKILIENVSIVNDTTAKGYNSSSYDYERFTITAINPQLGFSGPSITYNLAKYLTPEEYPGEFDSYVSSGSVVPEKFFPIFDISLSKNIFLKDEAITYQNKSGTVMFWNSANELLTISTSDAFDIGDLIIGSDSQSQGIVDKVFSFDSYYKVNSSSVVRKGWKTEKGFLDNEFQRIPNNDYYQKFAYSLKSKIDYSTWNSPVSSLNHIAGFKKFADLVVETSQVFGIQTTQTSTVSDLLIYNDSEVDFNCINDYDLVSENNYLVDETLTSNQINFKSRILSDYSECVGNRVLNIDDISSKFDGSQKDFDLTSNSNPIFKRTFNGSDPTIVNLIDSTIFIDNHYFTNGEQVTYSYSENPIGINTVSITGIGSTDKLPTTVYIIKYNETTIGLSTSAGDALKDIPVPIGFASLGIGITHSFTSAKQNSKALISLGGVIQSPITSTASTSIVSSYVGIASTAIVLSGNSNISSGDFVKIDDEIIKVSSVDDAIVNNNTIPTTLLLHFDGTNGSTNFIQSQETQLQSQVYGSAQIATDYTKWGTGSGRFSFPVNEEGYTGHSLAFDSTNILPGTGDFTIECWIYIPTSDPIRSGTIIQLPSGATGWGRLFVTYIDSVSSQVSWVTGSNTTITGHTISVDSWHHVWCTRENGVISMSANNNTPITGTDQYDYNYPLFKTIVGNYSTSNTYGFGGRIDDLRYTVGYARPLSVPTGPYTIENSSNYKDFYLSVERSRVGTGIATHAIKTIAYKIQGDYNIVDSKVFFVEPPKGPMPIGTTTGSPEDIDYVGITTTLDFNGRVFLRNGIKQTTNDAYSTNYVFDDISHNFNGITTSFILKSDNQNITGFAGNNANILVNEVVQSPSDLFGVIKTPGSYNLDEHAGITSVRFLGAPTSQSYDANATGIPVGGVIVSIGYTQGLGLQPLVSAGGTAIVSIAGTITGVSIGNSGSGYRSGLQTVNVGICVSTTGISTVQNIGIASVLNGNVVSVAITNPGIGYSYTEPPILTFDPPYPYTNLSLNYVNPTSGLGTGAKVNLSVGLAGSITDLEVINKGFAYKNGEVLSVSIGGSTGIPVSLGTSYIQPTILVSDTYNSKFSGWTFGELQLIDPIETHFDGKRKLFPIKIDGQFRNIRTKYGSPVDIQSTLLVFVNGILQLPGKGYIFNGGSFITFTEAPLPGFSCTVLFYRGSGETDVIDVDVLETIKTGDALQITGETDRFVSKNNTSDSVLTIPYNRQGITNNETISRPVKWCKQTEDIFINQKAITKNREIYEPLIEPTSNVIKSVGITTTVIFVENARTIFDDNRETTDPGYKNKLRLVSQMPTRVAIATASVSIAGTISSVNIVDGGEGYTSNPIISISNPVGMGTTARAYATASIASGVVTTLSVTNSGIGYTYTSPPQVLVSPPATYFENLTYTSLQGDFGLISGISTTSVGVASTGLVFNLYIPTDSVLRNNVVVGTAITVSGIQTGYYFVTKNTFVGNGITSLESDNSVLSIGSSFIDNVYRVADVSIGQTTVSGIGTTTVARVTVSVTNNNISGLGYTSFYGTYSWGRITTSPRTGKAEFSVYNNGIAGVNTSPILKRINPLKYQNYT